MLKTSVRNCRRKRSVSSKFLKIEKSSLWKPGPATGVRPPKAPAPVKATHPVGVLVPNTQGWVNAAALPNQLNLPFESVCRPSFVRSEEHTSELQSQFHLVCRLL